MGQITLRDSRNLLEAVAILNENLDLSTLAQRTVAAVMRVLPADMVTYNEVDLVHRVDRIFIAPDDARLAPVVQHAGLQMIGVAANRALSDFTEHERACLAALRSHVVQAYRNGLSIERVRAESHCGRTTGAAGCAAVGGLTQREAEVLHWAARGLSNDHVARIIGATSATVKKHLEHIYDKLGVTNRTAASALYIQLKRG
jgi:DNA-binding CsgD family transcriptional regulator